MGEEHIIETGVRDGEDISAHGRFFAVYTADRSRFLAKGHLHPSGEVVVVSGVVPDNATQAKLEALASEKPKAAKAKPAATADTDAPPLLDSLEVETPKPAKSKPRKAKG